MRKRYSLLMLALLAALGLCAQVPQTFVYQTVVRGTDGRLASSRQVGVRIAILRGSPSGTAVYTDQQQVQANMSGLITLTVGNPQNPLGGIDWASGPYYFRCEADPDGGSNYSHNEVHQLLAVPYAALAHTADSIGRDQYVERDPLFLAWGKDYRTLINQPAIFSGRYADLRNLPTLFSGSYLDLTDTPAIPTIPTLLSAFTNDVGYITSYTEQQSLADAVAFGNSAGGQLKSVSDPTDPLDVLNLHTLDSSLAHLSRHYDSVLSRRQRVLDSLLAATCFTTYGDTTAIACGQFFYLGHTYTSSGHFYQVIDNARGCDSIIAIHLTLHANVSMAAVQCEHYTWTSGTGQTYTTSGHYTYAHSSTDGCMLVDTLHLTINHPSHTADDATACETYAWHGQTYAATGNYTYSHIDGNGCTQVDTLHLTIHNPIHQASTQTACETYTWSTGNGQTYTASGNYTCTHTDANTCTQVDTLHLTINNPTHVALTVAACETYTWTSGNGSTYTASGHYTYVHPDANSCTQVDTLHLTVSDIIHTATTITACDSYTWTSGNGNTYSTSGNYIYDHIGANGCTQVDTLHLTINTPVHQAFAHTACETYAWHGQTYAATGNYTYSHIDGNGCTQVDSLHLTIHNPVHQASTQTACETYTWSTGNGQTYTASGNYTYTHADANTCTQVDTLHLTINNPSHVALTVVACETYTWTSGNGSTYTTSGHYTYTHTDVNTCTQVDTLHLTISDIVHTATTTAACDSYTWTSGNGNTYSTSGNYIYNHIGANGCTQVDTLHLTINRAIHTALTSSQCDSYTWATGNGQTYTVSGNHTYSHTDTHGCTQVDTLHLTISQSSSSDTTATACEYLTYHGTTYTASGDYRDTLTNAAGCDSVVTLHLTLHLDPHGFDANGASLSSFSVAAGRTVHFSQGNLQYNAAWGNHSTNDGGTAQGTWRFATHQYDTICSNNRNASSSYNGWIDLFGWGTSGWNSGNTYYQPWCTAGDSWSGYGPAGNHSLIGTYANADWGVYNAISNGGNTPNQWRTLTSDEWQYLFNTRSASTVNGTANARYAKASVCGVHGVILFPDTYSHPSSVAQPVGINATGSTGWTGNSYTATDWAAMEDAGAVFLPATGYRIDDMTGESGEGLHYWSATSGGDSYAYRASIRSYFFDAAYNGGRLDGIAVRLVKDISAPCTITYGDTTATAVGSFTWHGTTYTETPAVAPTYTYTNAAGCDSVVTLHLTILPEPFTADGATRSTFSISSSKAVKFSKGNLQYNAASGTHAVSGGGTAQGTWRFAEHQYDYIGSANSNISSSYNGWIDMFGWGTSGWNSGAVAYQPWSTSSSSADYYPGGSANTHLTGAYANADWGVYNAISNGGNQPGQWRTLTKDEWEYLFNTRTASTVNGTANARYAKAHVAGVSGVIIFPDVYTHPSGITTPNNINTVNASFTTNNYTASQWESMEAAGSIFLPVTGYRYVSTLYRTDTLGDYWSSTSYNYMCVFDVDIYPHGISPRDTNTYRSVGLAVRLVQLASGCEISYGDTTATAVGSFTWHGTTYTEMPAVAPTYTYTNAAGCDSVVTLHLTIVAGGFDANGATLSRFSVASGRTVKFSKGNLQYNAASGTHAVSGGGTAQGTWRFAEHQYDYIGSANSNISSSYNGWIDMFGWGTSGWNSGAVAYQPWSTSSSSADYYPGGSANTHLTGAYANADWGVYNAISNGGNQPGLWRTLTSAEWEYLFNTRTASTVNGTANARYAKAQVAGVSGVIIFPDVYTHPSGITTPNNINTVNASFTTNNYTASQWESMEAAGSIFLPVTGYRYVSTLYRTDTLGDYWSSTSYNYMCVFDVDIYPHGISPRDTNTYRSVGLAVRLVQLASGCEISYGDTTATAVGSFTWHGTTYTETPAVAPTYTYTNAAGCDSVVTLHLTIVAGGFDANGATLSRFSVAAGRTVKFSKGNLQYNAASGTHAVSGGGTAQGTWRFAEHQWDTIGAANSNISSTYNGWVDLFGWGTSGWNSGANAYQPWSTSTSYTDYYPGGSYTNNLTGSYANADWGVYNAISNGGNQPGLWRTLTSAEWEYLFNTRTASTVNGTANARYAKAQVAGVSGVIIFPDVYTHPSGITTPNNINTVNASFSTNNYTASQWESMEAAGSIFLPVTGYRYVSTLYRTDTLGDYWSSTSYNYMCVFDVDIYPHGISPRDTNTYRSVGLAVRLVQLASGCEISYGDTTATAVGSFSWHGTTYTETPAVAPTYTYTNAAGCDSVVTLHLTILPEPFTADGATRSTFSISSSKAVKFSKGNLQYNAASGTHAVSGGGTAQGTWRFAEHQYDYIGSINSNISSSYNGWIDLFGWGTSGWNSGANAYQPWSTSTSYSDYYPGGAYTNSLTGSYANADWAVYNAISNGGNTPNQWRTLTSAEWEYLFNTRSASTVNGTANARYAKAEVNGVHGIILFPDAYTHPAGVPALSSINTAATAYDANTYTTSQWALMEAAGCVFLPAAGNRIGSSVYDVGAYGRYWSSTYYGSVSAYCVYFGGDLNPSYNQDRCNGRSVRPVYDPSTPCTPTVGDTTATAVGSFTWHGTTYTETPAVAPTYTYTNAAGCDSVVTLHLTILPEPFTADGATRSAFSVAAGRTVKFSKGNLQYNAASGTHTVSGGGTAQGTWRFAEHQYDFIGSTNSNISSTYNGWIDLFGWGTSGWNSGANAYQPWSTSTTSSYYYPGGAYTNDLTGSYAKADWGVYNAISNGGNTPNQWRTLTNNEWLYLFNTRTASTVNGTANARYAKAAVNGIHGVILFPDTYTHPDGVAQPTGINAPGNALGNIPGWNGNNYTTTDWALMEAAGCVFLPAAGDRNGTSVDDVGTSGFYWSSTRGVNSSYACRVYSTVINFAYRYYGYSVRPVQD